MGADYYAMTYLGFQITKADLVREEMKQVVLCDHPSAKGKKFCPECGRPEKQRVVSEMQEIWRDPVRLRSADRNHDLDFEEMVRNGSQINDLILHRLNNCSEGDGGPVILGFPLAQVNGEDQVKNPTATDVSTLLDQIDQLTQKQHELGLTPRPIQLWTLAYVSV